MMMISHHKMKDNGKGLDRGDRVHPYAQAPQTRPIPAPQTPPVPPIQPMVIQEPFTVPDEDTGNSGGRQWSISRERAPVHVPIHTDDESATVEPQSRVSDLSRSPQGNESPQRQKEKKTTAEVKKPSELHKAKKHKPVDADEDDEVPHHESGTCSNTQPPVPVLPLQSGSTSSSHGPSTSTASTSSQRTSTVPALRTTPLTTMTIMEKENLAQQYKVHEVMTPEEQCSTQTFTFWPMMSIEQWRQKLTSMQPQPGHFVLWLRKTENTWMIFVPRWSDQRFQQHTSWIPKRSLQSNQRYAGTLHGHQWKRTQEQEPRGDPGQEKKHQPRKYEDTTSCLLKRNTSSGNPGLTMRFLISLILGSSNRRIMLTGR